MFQILTEYLFQYKTLFIPGTGRFNIEDRNAVNDLTQQTLQAPGWNVSFKPATAGAVAQASDSDTELFEWLAAKLKISAEDATLRFDEFSDGLKNRLANNEKVDWPGVGRLEQNNKEIVFTADKDAITPFTGVSAKKVLRENANHQILVGETETTSDEMRVHLANEQQAGGIGKKLMWILLLIAMILLAWYFFQNGCNLHNTGNQQKTEVVKPHDTYRLR